MGNFQRLARFWIVLAALVTIVTLLPSQLQAQTFFGSIVGTVTDASGAVVPGATVTITNLGTNETRAEKADAAGNYRFVNLVPANYKVTVEAANYKRFLRQPVTVAVDNTSRVDAAMAIGAATETVEVTTQAPLLQTDSGTIGDQVEGKTVTEMPLNGRNTLNMIALVPGVTPGNGSLGASALNSSGGGHTTTSTWANYNISGGLGEQSVEYIDGVPDNALNNQVALIPTQDAVQEFQVQANDVSAEFGRFSGGVMEMATKSGSNHWHGSAYEYVRNMYFNGNLFFSNNSGVKRQQWNQNQFGVVASGPVIKDKLFGMFAWERFSSRTGVPESSNTATTGTTGMQQGYVTGNLVTSLTQSLCPSISYNATTNQTYAPSSCWDPTATVLKGLYPAPNASLKGANWYNVASDGDDQTQYNGRADWAISNKQRFFARFSWWSLLDRSVKVYNDYGGFKTGNGMTQMETNQSVLGDTYTINPTTILDIHIGYTRWDNNALPDNGGHVDLSGYGGEWPSLSKEMTWAEYPITTLKGSYSFFNLTSTDDTTYSWYDNYSVAASLTKIVGQHTLKIGTEERMQDNVAFSNCCLDPSGVFIIDRTYIKDEWLAFLLGYPTSVTQHNTRPVGSYDYSQAYYVADNWTATKKLTLNLGLRWDLPGGIAERSNNSTVLLPNATDPYTNVTGTVALVQSSLYPGKTTQNITYKEIQPRVGFAYRLTNNTVIRGGYGLVYTPVAVFGGNGVGPMPSGSIVDSAETSWTNTGTASGYTLSNPFPNGLNQATGRSNPKFMTNYVNNGQSVSDPIPTNPYGYYQQRNFTVAQQMKGEVMIEVNYVGAVGTHLHSNGNGSANNYSINQLPAADFAGLNTMLAGFGSSPTSAQIASLIATGQSERPFPAYQNLYDTNHNNGSLTYNALQARVEKRFASGGLVSGAYTWQKTIADTDASSDLPSGNEASIQDFTNLRNERSIIAYNIPQHLAVDYVLNAPFGKGQKWGATTKGVLGSVISGWGSNGIYTLMSGQPIGLTTATGNYVTNDWGAGYLRPNYTPGCKKTLPGSAYARFKAGAWFNTACFSQPSAIQLGNEPRIDGTLREQGIDNFDFTALKTTTIHENMNLQFRAEFFNLFNHPQFADPSQSLGSSFGVVTKQQNWPRLVQFALRLNF